MSAHIKSIAGVSFSLAIVTSPVAEGATVNLTALYGTGGDPVGSDADGEDLVLPLVMEENVPGAYSTDIVIHEPGVYWARVEVNGVESVYLIRTVVGGVSADAVASVPIDVGAIIATSPASCSVTMRYATDGSSAGSVGGDAVTWPQSMTVVPGYSDSWFFPDVEFADAGKIIVTLTPLSGLSSNFAVLVESGDDPAAWTHFDGWVPDDEMVPAEWMSLSYIRRWTGWASSTVPDETLRELRAMAIETFVRQTNVFACAWTGSWHSLVGQGERVYLPMPIVLPAAGGVEPVVRYRERVGEKVVVEELNSADLAWRVTGPNAKQPFIELFRANWDDDLDVEVYATWGLGVSSRVPLNAKQALVGLCRWHSMSLGVDGDAARDQATLNRTTHESNRDVTHLFHETAIGMGITGDRTTDRLLMEFTVAPGPWIRRST